MGASLMAIPSLSRTGVAAELTRQLSPSASPAPKHGGRVTWAWLFEPIAQMDPQLPTAANNGDLATLMMLYDSLLQIEPHTLIPGPGLADAWEVSKDGKSWTFNLRDAEFYNGQKVTAQDVAFSLERWANPKINVQFGFLSAIDTVEALDPKTVRVTNKYVQGEFLATMAHPVAGIVPKAIVEAQGKQFGQHPVGSGPFIFSTKTPGESITLRRNPNYWKTGKPYLDGMVFTYVPEDNARMLQITSGQADIGPIPYALVPTYRNHQGTYLQFDHTSNVVFVLYNQYRHPFQDRNVRLALNYATPRQALNTVVFKDTAQIANSFIGQLQYWDPKIPALPYDIDKAKGFMAKSIVPKGFNTTLLIDGQDSDSQQMAPILQAAWTEIGINAKIVSTDGVTQGTRTRNYDYDLMFWPPDASSSDIGADDELGAFYYVPLQTKFGLAAYSDPKVLKLFNHVTHTNDQALRQKIFSYLQYYTAYVDPCGDPIAFGPARWLIRDRVHGVVTLFDYAFRAENIWVD
jgi:peptide/nickel transport system substrate-binding protein